MIRRIIFLGTFCILLICLGLINLSCTNKANGGEEPQTADAKKYYTKEEVDALLAQYYPKSDVDILLSKNKSSIIGYKIELARDGGAGITYWNNNWSGLAYGEEWAASSMCPINGSLRNLCVKTIYGGPLNTDRNVEVMVRVNNADTPLMLVYTNADGTSLKVNSTDSVQLSQGDMICLQTTVTGSQTSVQYLSASFLFDAAE